MIDADLGVGNRHLVVMSGIAIYNWTIDTDELTPGEVRVKLGVYARELERACLALLEEPRHRLALRRGER